ncbi:MAG: DUF5667 domain-containing protein [Anaerolineales bacterium]
MTNHNIQPELNEYLKALKEKVPQRDPEMAAKGRANFLSEVKELQAKKSTPWLAEIFAAIFSLPIQANRRLATAVASILTAIVLTFGAVGGTVYASQDSLPKQTLYAVKTLTEDIRLRFSKQPEEKIRLLEKFANRRVEELSALSEKEEEFPEETITRLEQHTETILKIASKQEGKELTQSLKKIRKSLQAQEEIISKLANMEHGNADKKLTQVQKKLREKIHLAEEGLDNPAAFRKKMKSTTPFTPVETLKPGKPEETRTPENKRKPVDRGTPIWKGKPDQVGTPDHKGKPGEAGQQENKGKPNEPGSPDDKGKPEDPGPPDDKRGP